MEIDKLKQIVEGALLAAAQPLSLNQLNALFPEDEQPGFGPLREALAALDTECQGRAVELKEVASGYRLQVRDAVMPWIGRLWAEKPPRYSRALLETLAIIAYRQPITRAEIEEIRGVSVSSSILRTLQEREWIKVVGHRDVPGRPELLGTTKPFLDYFNLKSLDDLPTLAEIKDLDDLEPELALNDPDIAANDDASKKPQEDREATPENAESEGPGSEGPGSEGPESEGSESESSESEGSESEGFEPEGFEPEEPESESDQQAPRRQA